MSDGHPEELWRAFRAAGVFEPAHRYQLAWGLAAGGLYALCYGALLAEVVGAARVAALLGAAFAGVQVAMVAHEAAHGALPGSTRVRAAIGQACMSFANGYSYAYFRSTHLPHHAHTNDPAQDPDMRAGVIGVYRGVPGANGAFGRLVRRYQCAVLPFGLLLWNLSLRKDGVRYVLGHRRDTGADQVALGLHALLWLGLPVLILGVASAALNYLVVAALGGVYVGALFIVNHVGMPVVAGDTPISYVDRQVRSGRDIAGSALVTFLCAGLDLQIEHHLAPSVPYIRLRRARGIVRAYCQGRGLPYHETTYVGAWREVLRHLAEVGRQSV